MSLSIVDTNWINIFTKIKFYCTLSNMSKVFGQGALVLSHLTTNVTVHFVLFRTNTTGKSLDVTQIDRNISDSLGI